MDEKELKKIHGADVELAPDDSEDEKLTEKKALARAKRGGVIFKDEWVVLDGFRDVSKHDTEAEAQKARKGDETVAQRRYAVQPGGDE